MILLDESLPPVPTMTRAEIRTALTDALKAAEDLFRLGY